MALHATWTRTVPALKSTRLPVVSWDWGSYPATSAILSAAYLRVNGQVVKLVKNDAA
jgi:hypothetical protein